MTLKTHVYNSADEEVQVIVDFLHHKGMKGFRDKFGAQETPDDPPEIEIRSVTTINTNEEIGGLLSDEQLEEIVKQCWASLND